MTGLLAGRYRLGAPIGHGGSADVFAARDELLDRPVAVKLARHAGDPDVRLQAQATARLDHPRIVRVLDTGQDEGRAWAVLDLVEGSSLRDLLGAAGPPAPADAVAVLTAVLEALSYAHARGVHHGDLSPGNVLVPVVDGAPCWAQARVTDLAAPHRSDGHVVVSPHYAAPEVATGGLGDARSDLYAAGAVLVHLLTGAPPFDDDDPQAVLAAQVARAPDAPSTRAPGLSAQLDEVVLTALAKDPADRYPSADAMAAALARAPVGSPGRDGPIGAAALANGAPGAPLVRRPRVPGADGSRGTRPMPVVGAPARAPAPPAARRRGAGWAVAAMLLVAAAVGTGAALNGAAHPGEPPAAAVPASPSASRTPTPAPIARTPSPPSTVRVPDLVGGTVDDARARLAAVGLVVGEVVERDGSSAAGTVLLVDPAPGGRARRGDAVALTVASGFVAVPAVSGLDAASADAVLRSAGLVPVAAVVTGPAAAGAPAGIAAGTLPAQDARLPVGGEVQLLVSGAGATPIPTASGTGAAPSPSPSGSPSAGPSAG